MKTTETKRCRNIRRVLIALFVVCGYLLSTTFISAYVTVDGKEKLITETALNLTFGSVSGSTPVYRNTVVGAMYFIIPLVGFLFMFFDHRSNVKNLVGIICGIVGCVSIGLPIGSNPDFYMGIGAVVSMLLYTFVTMLSAISVFMKLEDDRKNKSPESAPRLQKHET